jgi:hypothetical protein
MKNWMFILFLGLGMALISCSEQAPAENEEPATDQTENAEAENADTPAKKSTEILASGDQYQIKMLDAKPKSPRKEMTGAVQDIGITVNYGSPKVKGRTVWGDLVSYGKVWRCGANEATTLTLDTPCVIGGNKVPDGTYALFVIPGEDGTWTVILNEDTEQWGASEYDEAKDVARFDITPTTGEDVKEELDFMIMNDQLMLAWEKINLAIPVTAS